MLLVSIISIVLICIDQISKILVSSNIGLNKSIEVIPNFFNLTYLRNYGGAFNIFDGGRWFFIILGILTIVLIVRFVLVDKSISKFDLCAYSLVLSGTIGNVIDRVIHGYVIDFISFNIFGYNFAVFNLADAFIVIGAILIGIILLIKGDSNENIHSRK